MKQVEVLHTGVDGGVHRVDIAGVAPAALLLIILRRVLGVVNEHVHVLHEFLEPTPLLFLHRFEQVPLMGVEFRLAPLDGLINKGELVV